MGWSRRRLITLTSMGAAGVTLAAAFKNFYTREAQGQPLWTQGYGPLQPDPQGILDLPKGFRYQILSRTGDRMNDGQPVPGSPDGMAAFAGPNQTTILIRNHELEGNSRHPVTAAAAQRYDRNGRGGTTTLILDRDRQLLGQFVSLAGTSRNCGGGPTPWGSWISCEETVVTPTTDTAATPVSQPHGYNFEVPAQARGPVDPQPLVAMGRFNHEAIAVDPRDGLVYQTEDRIDGLLYRFMPHQPGRLQAGGRLEALRIKNRPQALTQRGWVTAQPMAVDWVEIQTVNPAQDTVRHQGFAQGAAQFSRGEGIYYAQGQIYFTCTNGGDSGTGQIWRYTPNPATQTGGVLELLVEARSQSLLQFPDNLAATPWGDLIVCEDRPQGQQHLIGLTPAGQLYPFAHNALNTSEFAGACFSPDGQTLFVNLQRPGITFAIGGPWPARS